MLKTKFEMVLSAVLLLIIGGLGAWWYLRPTPKQQFIREVEKAVATVNEGKHIQIQEKFSPEFVQYLQGQGVEPRQILLICRQLDTNQQAQYRMQKLSLYEEKFFAEVDFVRKSTDGEQLFTLPFVYRDGKWWITDHFKSEKTFESLQGLQQ
jgi:hypothetical protein